MKTVVYTYYKHTWKFVTHLIRNFCDIWKSQLKSTWVLRTISFFSPKEGLKKKRHKWCQNCTKQMTSCSYCHAGPWDRDTFIPGSFSLILLLLLLSLQVVCSLSLLHLPPSEGWSRSLEGAPQSLSYPWPSPAVPGPRAPCPPWWEPCSCSPLPSGAPPSPWCPAPSLEHPPPPSLAARPQHPEERILCMVIFFVNDNIVIFKRYFFKR